MNRKNHTLETRLKMSLIKKGKISSFKGKKHSLESKEKMSLSRQGKFLTQEHKNNISIKNTGKNHTEESKKKISLIHLGKKKNYKTWQTGTKGLIKPNSGNFKKGFIPWNKGKTSKIPKEKHYNWRGGITSLNHQIRSCLRYKQWHKEVLSIDWFKCTECNSKKELEVDHIKPFSVIIRENKIKSLEEALMCNELWELNNGRTLCFECHKRTKTYGRKADNY